MIDVQDAIDELVDWQMTRERWMQDDTYTRPMFEVLFVQDDGFDGGARWDGSWGMTDFSGECLPINEDSRWTPEFKELFHA